MGFHSSINLFPPSQSDYKTNLKYFFPRQPVFASLPSGFEQSGVFLDPHRVMVKNIL
jgi:hypothetical protein